MVQFTAYVLTTTCARATTVYTAPGKHIAKDINFQLSGDDQGECCVRIPTQKSLIEQQLPVFPESDNTHDKKAVAVYKDGSVVGLDRGVSRKLSRGVLNYRRALARVIFWATPPYFVTTPSILLVDNCNVKYSASLKPN